MIRAHLATFPPRADLLAQVVARIAPQVDHLAVTLNQHSTIPGHLAQFSNVEPILPPRDLMDAGKFLPAAAPDDRVFLIDDDIAYPPDYVARTLDMAERRDLTRNAFGYQGTAWRVENGTAKARPFIFRRKLGAVRGVSQLGSGTALLLGRHLPPLERVEPAKGWVDIRFSRHLFDLGIRPWVLPREAGWLPSLMTDELRASSLHSTVARARPDLYTAERNAFVTRWDHAGLRWRQVHGPT